MVILDNNWIRQLEQIVVHGKPYNLHYSVYRGIVHSAVIGMAEDGSYLPESYWNAGVCLVDKLLGDTSTKGPGNPFPFCAIHIKRENDSIRIRTREHYEIDFGGLVN